MVDFDSETVELILRGDTPSEGDTFADRWFRLKRQIECLGNEIAGVVGEMVERADGCWYRKAEDE